MAIVTSVASGLWSASGTWDVAVPLSGDTVVVAPGHTVTFDISMTGGLWANGVDLTINGTLSASLTPGAYVLKSFGNNIRGSGTLRAGTQAAPYPVGCTFTLDHAGSARYVDLSGGLTADLNCFEPGVGATTLNAAAAAGATVLSLATDASGSWVMGQEVLVVNMAVGRNEEKRTIASVGASTVTLTAGLTSAKVLGAKVLLLTRNVKSINATDRHINGGSNGRLGFESWGGSYGVYYGSGHTISGSAASGCSYGVLYGSGHTISGSAASGCSNGVLYGSGHTISGSAASGCSNGVYSGSGHTISGSAASGCSNGVYSGSVVTRGWTPTGNATDVGGYLGTSAAGGTALSGEGATRIIDSRRHAGVAGERRLWSPGGYAATDPTITTAGYPASLKLTLQSATLPSRVDDTVLAQSGIAQSYGGWLKLGALGQEAHVRVQLADPTSDPLLGGTPEAEFVPAATLDWQQVALPITPDEDRPLILRALGKAASGNLWWIPVTAPPRTGRVPGRVPG